jgi:hypothetical protein
MPIEFRIDPERRMVWAQGRGTLTDQDVFSYQQDVWSRPEVAGYNELFDMTDVEQIALPSSRRVQDLAALAAEMDAPHTHSKFAIVAPDDLAYGIGRMYKAHRELQQGSTKQVAVFRCLKAALEWLEKNQTDPEE